jgi:nucleotide-binding universal stress UspA family protein
MRYVVGVDGSVPSEWALRWAERRAVQAGVALVLVHVTDEGEDPAAARQLLDGVEARVRAAHPDLDVAAVLRDGSAAWELARTAGADDILVVGTHKTGFSSGRILGSLSVQVAATSSGTVAVIPSIDVRFRRGVVAGIDRVETAAHISELAAAEALDRGDELTLVHAGAGRAGDDDALRTALDRLGTAHPRLTVRARHSSRSPSAALLDVSRAQALLVIGRGATGDDRSPIGSVVHEVLLNANSPVLVAGAPTRSGA